MNSFNRAWRDGAGYGIFLGAVLSLPDPSARFGTVRLRMCVCVVCMYLVYSIQSALFPVACCVYTSCGVKSFVVFLEGEGEGGGK